MVFKLIFSGFLALSSNYYVSMILKFPLAFAAPNYISLQKNFYLTCQGQQFQDSMVAHIPITEPTLVTGRVKGRGEEVQPEDKGNKEDRGKSP